MSTPKREEEKGDTVEYYDGGSGQVRTVRRVIGPGTWNTNGGILHGSAPFEQHGFLVGYKGDWRSPAGIPEGENIKSPDQIDWERTPDPQRVGAREKHDDGHPHLINGEFQSDKYPSTPRGKVPLSVKDPKAQPYLWLYAQDHRPIDPEFSRDLEVALQNAGYVHGREARKLTSDAYEALIAEDRAWLRDHTPNCLERRHIDSVLEDSIERYYPPPVEDDDSARQAFLRAHGAIQLPDDGGVSALLEATPRLFEELPPVLLTPAEWSQRRDEIERTHLEIKKHRDALLAKLARVAELLKPLRDKLDQVTESAEKAWDAKGAPDTETPGP